MSDDLTSIERDRIRKAMREMGVTGASRLPSPPNGFIRRVVIEAIPHECQEYDTCGDYHLNEGTLRIYVSRMKDWRMQLLVAVHELVEAALCVQRGIPFTAINEWDDRFAGDADEPGEARFETTEVHGDSSTGIGGPVYRYPPYYAEHLTATVIERMVAFELGLYWPEYEHAIYALSAERKEEGRSE